jgi:hypothetical protein
MPVQLLGEVEGLKVAQGANPSPHPGTSLSSQLPAGDLTSEDIGHFKEGQFEIRRQLRIQWPLTDISSDQKVVLARLGSRGPLDSSTPDLEIHWNIRHEPPSTNNDNSLSSLSFCETEVAAQFANFSCRFKHCSGSLVVF